MTHVNTAVIIASARRDLADLAGKSVQRFAPSCYIAMVDNGSGIGRKHYGATGGMRDHAGAIEYARSQMAGYIDHVVMLDDDALVTSPEWLPTLRRYHEQGYGIVGGRKHRALPGQLFVDGVVVPHAHCLSMTREVFESVKSFHAEPEAGVECLRYDTGVRACLEAVKQGVTMKVLPHKVLGMGSLFPGMDVAEYYADTPLNMANMLGGGETLWAHLGRGTSFARSSWPRELIRSLTALYSPRSQKIRRRQSLRAAYLTRGKLILAGSGA